MTVGSNNSGEAGRLSPAPTQPASSSRPLASLFGDSARLAMERAVAELRSARPVRLQGAEGTLLVMAAESLGGQGAMLWHDAFQSHVALILPQPRLAHLGFDVAGPARIALDGMAAKAIDDILLAPEPDISAIEPQPASALEELALTLIKHAYLLPAAFVAPDDGTSGATLTVGAEAVAGYHDRTARQLEIATRSRVPLSEAVDTEFVVFRGGDGQRDQVAIIVGKPGDGAVPVRLHSACLTGDLFGSLKCDCGDQLRGAVAMLEKAGGGVLLYLDQEGRGIGLRNKMRAYGLQEMGHDTLEADAVLGYGPDERRYMIAGRMLTLLGINRVLLLTNSPSKIAGLEQAGIQIAGHQRILGRVNGHNRRYLETKARAGHLLGDLSDDGP